MSVPLIQAAEAALGRQRAPQHETGEHIVQYLRSANIGDGFLDLSDVKSMNFTPSEQARFRLRAGDLLVTEGSGSRDTVGSSAVWRDELPSPICFQNTVLRIRPRAGTSDGRYLAWWMRHAHASGLIAAVATGANILHLGAENLRRLPIDLPSLVEQQRIAGFLDDQVSRLDEAVNARQQQVALVRERHSGFLDETLAKTSESRLLSSLTDPQRPVQYGIVLPGPNFDGGVPIVKGGDVAAHRMDPALLNRTDPAIESGYPRSRLVAGDILIAIRGSVGELATVPASLSAANITQDAARIAPFGCDPLWLRWVLATPLVQGRVSAMVTGATVKGINIGDLRRILVPWVNDPRQRELAQVASETAEASDVLARSLQRSVSLLQERKRALITAAVTGEFDVTTASGRGIG